MMINDDVIPDWLHKKSNGDYMEIGAQLCTRDGRKIGNALVSAIIDHHEIGLIAEIVTDKGNKTKCTLSELQEFFYPPIYVVEHTKFVCEVCGSPAKLGVLDVIQRENYRLGYVQHEPDGEPHYFCDEHIRESQITPGEPIGAVPIFERDEVDWGAAEAWIEERAETDDEQ